jgi:hypothetical protein
MHPGGLRGQGQQHVGTAAQALAHLSRPARGAVDPIFGLAGVGESGAASADRAVAAGQPIELRASAARTRGTASPTPFPFPTGTPRRSSRGAVWNPPPYPPKLPPSARAFRPPAGQPPVGAAW